MEINMNNNFEQIIQSLNQYVTGIYGHKKSLLKNILSLLPEDCKSVGEPFGGTGIVTAAIKRTGRKVISNDQLRFAYLRILSLVVCNKPVLTDADLEMLATPNPIRDSYVKDNYDVFFGESNGMFLDSWGANIRQLDSVIKKQVAIFMAVVTVMQEIKSNRCTTNFSPTGTLTGNRHLREVNLRTATLKYAKEVYPTLLFDNGQENEVYRMDALELMSNVTCDAWYVDSPYCCPAAGYSQKLTLYEKLVMILCGEGHKIRKFRDTNAYLPASNKFIKPEESKNGFAEIFRRAEKVPLVLLSYNTTSEISPEAIASIAETYGRKVEIKRIPHPRPTTKAKSNTTRKTSTEEVILVCTF